MPVSSYDLDRRVFRLLNGGMNEFETWQGAASGIADYAASWGIERFWAMSRSPAVLGGQIPDSTSGNEEERRYFAWSVARQVLCEIVGTDLQIQANMTTDDFLERFRQLSFNQQVLMMDLLVEISEAIQFWTMRLKDARDSHMSA